MGLQKLTCIFVKQLNRAIMSSNLIVPTIEILHVSLLITNNLFLYVYICKKLKKLIHIIKLE